MTTEQTDIDLKVQEIAEGLLKSTPEEWNEIHCDIMRSMRQCGCRLEYEISCPEFPDDSSDQPHPDLHEAAHESLRGHPDIEGISLVMKNSGENGWELSVNLVYPDDDFDREKRDEDLFQAVYDHRMEFMQEHLGDFPEDILKPMTVHWPGGGIFKIENSKLDGTTVWTSFGLSNPDMPTSAYIEEFERVDGPNGEKTFKTKLGWHVPTWCPPTDSGYGYEVMVISKEKDMTSPIMYFVESELNHDTDWMYRVRRNGGMTIEEVHLGEGEKCDMILYPAQNIPPVEFSSGDMEILIATRVTREEMNWAREGKVGELVQKLYDAGHGQISVWDRKSVV